VTKEREFLCAFLSRTADTFSNKYAAVLSQLRTGGEAFIRELLTEFPCISRRISGSSHLRSACQNPKQID